MEGAIEPAPGPQAQRIAVFLRLRPVARPSGRIAASPQEGWVQFDVPKDAAQGLINNSRETYRFPFDGLLPPDAGQGEVFDRVALPVLRAALDGYNGTVFAFGQTGSGKTFTITGGTERYADRGLIPRAISALFAEAAARPGHTYAVHISYLEIYNESGFDLLEPGREVRALEDLPRVNIQEDDSGAMHLRNLSMHRCDTEEQALNMLFLGDTNRVVAETPLNQASSRSHCVFTLHIEARRAGADALVRRSKLHFVDLAGSERVGKSGLAAHTQLKEAKYINLSLHFLEQVIISLQEGRTHVPYRNSLLTMVLRDSLGGNTRTVMVAAVAPEAQHIEESISTCRFAQRVAMISNKVEVNEELDLEVVIRQLKRENALLRQELQLLRNGGASSSGDSAGTAEGSAGLEQRMQLTEAEQHVLRRQVQAFVEDPSPDSLLGVEPSMLFIRAAFDLLKGMARGTAPQGPTAKGPAPAGAAAVVGAATEAELRSLRQLVQRQEQQIKVLSDALLADQHKAFEYFCATSPAHDAVAEHKAVLRARYEEARTLGSQVSAAKQRISDLKAAMERRRLGRSMAALLRQQQGGSEEDEAEGQREAAEEERAKQQIEQEKAAYRTAYEQLKAVKADIDGVQAALERSRARLQADFQAWPLLTGNAAADRDIIRFYEARAALLKGMRA
ncbi:kinesinlike KIF6 [Chlorella sorokiniana]|uniref:Kinesin-like protein n=1 Tax=Chlorella sorokiniana TaxID=3076 RepID=A0A2P6U1I8_CHLSO|nr:kinesinlike KIF6 [Chlorella sorokiniana]|eukprot:PRW60177.1 kinesinlike KIF6 [Chlorella sorokiniana]